jgi:endonuclease/exonuclease/phosphatase family metal-dependent hydrolase
MRVIFFNIWHGKIWDGLKEFIKKESVKTDIFCFVEVDPDLQVKLQTILPKFNYVFHRGIKTDYLGGIREGRSIFVNKDIPVSGSKKVSLYKESKVDAGGLLVAKLNFNGKDIQVGAVHGKARPGTKLDTPIRINQSKIIIDYFESVSGPKIIGGDFNLNPDTKSIRMFEEVGYKNLIQDFGIKNTRNELSWKQFNNIQNFADYVFVSPEIKVKSFEVPYIEVSDHLPLILDFEI